MDVPLDTDNQENARSIVGVISHGPFRYLLAGDLTGTGTVDVPNVETHLVRTLPASLLDERGVDVVHASHHARRTSSNPDFVAAMAPRDGRSRNVVAGVTPAYVESPQAAPLRNWLDDDRLAGGWMWTTAIAALGSRHPRLADARSAVVVQTESGGLRYRVFAARASADAQEFSAVHEP